MAKNNVSEWDPIAANNTDVGGTGIQGTNAVSNFDNALREIMAQIRSGVAINSVDNALSGINTFSKIVKTAKGADVASASTLTLGDDGNYFDITGTTTITSIATKGVGAFVVLQFDAALTLTHNATDLVLPGAANITTAAGDHAAFEEYAPGDWRCVYYTRASGDRVIQKYLGFHGDPVVQSIGPVSTPTLINTYTGIVNNLPGASESGGIITVGASGFYSVTANLASLMPTIGSGSYSYALSASIVDSSGAPILSIAALPVLVSTASFGSLAGSSSGIVKLTAGQRVGAFLRHNLPSTNISVSVSLDLQFLGS